MISRATIVFMVTGVVIGCHEPIPPKAEPPKKGVHIEAPGVKVDFEKKGEKRDVKVDVDPKDR